MACAAPVRVPPTRESFAAALLTAALHPCEKFSLCVAKTRKNGCRKWNPNSPKHQASNAAGTPTRRASGLRNGADLLCTHDSRFIHSCSTCTASLTPDLLFWHWRAAFIAPLRERLSQYAPPLPLRYVYALDLYTYDTPVFYLLTDAPHAAVQAAFANFWIHGDNCRMKRLEDVGAAQNAQTLTLRAQGTPKSKKVYVCSRRLAPYDVQIEHLTPA